MCLTSFIIFILAQQNKQKFHTQVFCVDDPKLTKRMDPEILKNAATDIGQSKVEKTTSENSNKMKECTELKKVKISNFDKEKCKKIKTPAGTNRYARYRCELCDYKATTEDSLRKHYKSIHALKRVKSFYLQISKRRKGSEKYKKLKIGLKRCQKSSPNAVKYICGQCDYQPNFISSEKMELIFKSYYSNKEEDLCDWCIGDSRITMVKSNGNLEITQFEKMESPIADVKVFQDESLGSLDEDLDLSPDEDDDNDSLDGKLYSKSGA